MLVPKVLLFQNGIKSPSRRDGLFMPSWFGQYDFYGFLHSGVPSWQDGLLFPSCQMAFFVKMVISAGAPGF